MFSLLITLFCFNAIANYIISPFILNIMTGFSASEFTYTLLLKCPNCFRGLTRIVSIVFSCGNIIFDEISSR